jgi:hypothetical protein
VGDVAKPVPEVYASSLRLEVKLSWDVEELTAESVKKRSPYESTAKPPTLSCPVVLGDELVGSVNSNAAAGVPV